MPRKPKEIDPVSAFVAASQAYAIAKNNLIQAVRTNSLSPEQAAFYELLKVGFGEQQNSRQTPRRKETATDLISTDILENEKANQAAGNNLAH